MATKGQFYWEPANPKWRPLFPPDPESDVAHLSTGPLLPPFLSLSSTHFPPSVSLSILSISYSFLPTTCHFLNTDTYQDSLYSKALDFVNHTSLQTTNYKLQTQLGFHLQMVKSKKRVKPNGGQSQQFVNNPNPTRHTYGSSLFCSLLCCYLKFSKRN